MRLTQWCLELPGSTGVPCQPLGKGFDRLIEGDGGHREWLNRENMVRVSRTRRTSQPQQADRRSSSLT